MVNPIIEGEVRIESWEPGSLWILIFLKTIAAVELVGRVAKAAAILAQETARWKVITVQVESLKIKNEALREIADGQKKLLAEFLDRESRAIEDSSFPQHENERQERLKASIRTFSELIFKGAEVHPALTAPVDSKNLFPKYEELPLSDIKQLEDSTVDALPPSDTPELEPD